MNSIEKGANIRIGLKGCRILHTIPPTRYQTYSLEIDKKIILNSSGGDAKDFDYEEVAEKIAEHLNERKVKDYYIFPAELVPIGGNGKVTYKTDPIKKENEKIFRNKLEELVGKSAINEFHETEVNYSENLKTLQSS
jgi:hypothetical protein